MISRMESSESEIKALSSCLRGSWLTIHAHPMPWLGQPTASWLQAVIGGLWPMERKVMCYRLLIIAVTLRSGSSPQLQQVLGASLLCWEVMIGESPFQLYLLPTFSVYPLGLSPVILNQNGRLDQNQVYVKINSQVLMHALSSSCSSPLLVCWHFQNVCAGCVSVPLPVIPQWNSSALSLCSWCPFSDHWLSVYTLVFRAIWLN